MKPSYTGSLKEFAIGGGLVTVVALGGEALLFGGSPLPNTFWIGFGGFAVYMLLRGNVPTFGKRGKVFKNTVNLPGFEDDPDFDTRKIRVNIDEMTGAGFTFRHQVLPVPIRDARLIRLVERAQHRQRSATMGPIKNLKLNQVLSSKYYTKRLRGPEQFTLDELKSCIIILSIVNALQVSPRAGHPGLLWQEDLGTGAGELVEGYVTTWRWLLQRGDGNKKKWRFRRTR